MRWGYLYPGASVTVWAVAYIYPHHICLASRLKMPRKYIRKCPDRKLCTQEQINAAKKLMEEGKSKRKAAEIVGIDESTLRKRLKLNSAALSMGRIYKPVSPVVMRWSEQMTVDFIIEYIKHNCLYKVNSTFYRNKQKRNAALLQLSKRMGIPGFGPQDACNKIRILRTTYWKELKKIRNSNGSYTSNLKWFPILHEALMVADDFREIMNTQNYYIEAVSIPEAPEIQDEEKYADNSEIIIRIEREENHSDVLDSEENLGGTSDSDVDTKIGILPDSKSEESCSSQIKDPIAHTSTVTHTRKKPSKRKYDQMLSKNQYASNVDQPAEKTEHEFDIFGKSIAAQLKNMPLEIAIRAQMHMQNYLSGMRLKHVSCEAQS